MASTASTLNPDHVLLLEQATLKAPVDNLRRMQKMTQKTYDHNLGPASSFQKELDELLRKSAVASSSALSIETQEDMIKSVDSMLNRMRGLKRKLSDFSSQSAAAHRVTSARLEHLRSIPVSIDATDYPAWARRRLSHQLIDYFLRSAPMLKLTANVLAKEENIHELVDADLWAELAKAEAGLHQERLDEVLIWVGENRSALRKMNSPLEFTIHLQAFIELCRKRELPDAIAYVRKHLSSGAAAEYSSDSSQQPILDLNRAMALLAFPPDTTCKVYQELYSPARWTALLSLFRTTFLSIHSLPILPLLHLTLQAGIASLKTPVCSPIPTGSINSSSSQTAVAMEGTPSAECPICSSPLKHLAPEVPYSHHLNSTIVCSISGKVVDGAGVEGDGGLVAVVSRTSGEGRVYSRDALVDLVSQNTENLLIDPFTKETFVWDDLKKVFIS